MFGLCVQHFKQKTPVPPPPPTHTFPLLLTCSFRIHTHIHAPTHTHTHRLFLSLIYCGCSLSCSFKTPVSTALHTCRALLEVRKRKRRKAIGKPIVSTMAPARALKHNFPNTSSVAKKL